MIIYRWILLRMRSYRENQDIQFIFKNFFFFFRKSCCSRDNVEKYGTARQATYDNIIRCMGVACWITKAANTHSEYAILIAFERQQWLRCLPLLLRICAFVCLVRYFVWQTGPRNVFSLTNNNDHTITGILTHDKQKAFTTRKAILMRWILNLIVAAPVHNSFCFLVFQSSDSDKHRKVMIWLARGWAKLQELI